MLSSRFGDIVPTLGVVDDKTCLQNYNLLRELDFEAADLQCGTNILEEQTVLHFRNRFGEY